MIKLDSTKSYIFLLDTAFTIFFMTPPRITIPDLDFPFSYPDSCFHARTADEFFESVQQLCPTFPTTRETRIHRIIQMLCNTTNSTENYAIPELTDLGGFIMISGTNRIASESP